MNNNLVSVEEINRFTPFDPYCFSQLYGTGLSSFAAFHNINIRSFLDKFETSFFTAHQFEDRMWLTTAQVNVNRLTFESSQSYTNFQNDVYKEMRSLLDNSIFTDAASTKWDEANTKWKDVGFYAVPSNTKDPIPEWTSPSIIARR